MSKRLNADAYHVVARTRGCAGVSSPRRATMCVVKLNKVRTRNVFQHMPHARRTVLELSVSSPAESV